MDSATLTWIVNGVIGVLFAVIGQAYRLLREESKSQSDSIRQKVDYERFMEIKKQLEDQIKQNKEEHSKALDKLEQQHEKNLGNIKESMKEEIRKLEENIISRLDLILKIRGNNE